MSSPGEKSATRKIAPCVRHGRSGAVHPLERQYALPNPNRPAGRRNDHQPDSCALADPERRSYPKVRDGASARSNGPRGTTEKCWHALDSPSNSVTARCAC